MCFLQNEWASKLPFLLVRQLLPHIAARIYCLTLEMEKAAFEAPGWVLRGQGSGSTVVGTRAVLSEWLGLPLVPTTESPRPVRRSLASLVTITISPRQRDE